MGLAIRVLANGCWGFAATDDLTRDGVDPPRRPGASKSPAPSALAKKQDVVLAPGREIRGRHGCRRCASIRSRIPVDRNVGLAARHRPRAAPQPRRHPGRRRHELRTPPPGFRVFHRQPDRSDPLPQRRRLLRRSAYKDDEIQKRSYPNSFGGQYQLKGYELIDEWDLRRQRAPHRRRGRRAAHRRSVPRRRVRSHPRQLATRAADPRIHRPSHRARPRPRQRSQLRGHELPHARSAATACATDRKS